MSKQNGSIDERTAGDLSIDGRAGLVPDVCADCKARGHICKPHVTVDGVRLCVFCADGEPCAFDRDSAKKAERFAMKSTGAHQPARPAAKEKEQMKPQDPNEEPRICGHEGCGKKLRRNNTSGFCTGHWYDSKRKGEAEERQKPRKPRASAARKVNPKLDPGATVTIQVPHAALDAFWSKLTLEEKGRIYQRELEASW